MTTRDSQSIQVRPATSDDIEFMVHLFLQIRYQLSPLGEGIDVDAVVNGTRQATAEQVQGKVANSVTNVIECENNRVGRLRIVDTGEEVLIAGLQILPSYQQRGVGTTVINGVIDAASSRSLPVVVEAEKDNPVAQALYARLGFERYGETVDAYKLRRLPA